MKMDSPWSLLIGVALSGSSAAQEAEHRATLPLSTVSGSERPAANAKVVKVIVEDADCDETGPLHIVYADGTEVLESLPRSKARADADEFGNLEGFSDAQLAADKETVGWAEKYQICCQSYPVPLVLALYRSGKIVRRIQEGQIVWAWMFVDAGKQVAIEWGPTHGTSVGDFVLYEVETGRIVSKASGDERIQRLKRDAPGWAKRLEKKFNSVTSNPNPPCTKESAPPLGG